METDSSAPGILALTDGRAGNAAMAHGLAERVAGLTGLAVAHEAVSLGRLDPLPPRMQAMLPGGVLLRRAGLATRPRLVIGAGRRVAALTAALGRRGSRAVQILDPQMPARAFDLVVAPAHDRLAGPNVVSTLGSVNGVTPERLAAARAAWQAVFAPLPRPLVAVLIGGSTKRTTVTAAAVDGLAESLGRLGAGLAMTASRRTPPALVGRLTAALPGAWLWDGEGPNPYFGLLACADAIVVTDDSVNMASEAATAPPPVALAPFVSEGGKLARFHEALVAGGHAEWLGEALPTASRPLDETLRAAKRVASLLHA